MKSAKSMNIGPTWRPRQRRAEASGEESSANPEREVESGTHLRAVRHLEQPFECLQMPRQSVRSTGSRLAPLRTHLTRVQKPPPAERAPTCPNPKPKD